ncbi:hypothetical protein [Sporosarcina sp. ZBG7A]|uniref:hypothetical protein n=1 Tax=Sporosarcina sp. ZBG7A TaxID=1582223 RepID=UPI00057A1008|nr:hypothetical protein [Sporosarcina sp. ZBG7A]
MAQQNDSQTINGVRQQALVEHFSKKVGRRVFILTESFPFMFIGKIIKVVDDSIELYVQTTSVPALEGKTWFVHIDAIEVFYIETGVGAKIPDLKD